MGFNKVELAKEVGTGFSVGTSASFAFYFSKEFLSSSTHPHQFGNAFRSACEKGPRVGGALAAFCVVAYSVNSGIEYYRSKNDAFNGFASTTAGEFALNLRYGIKYGLCTSIGLASAVTLLDKWVPDVQEEKISATEVAKDEFSV